MDFVSLFDVIPLSLLLLLASAVLLYIYGTRNNTYFSSIGIPSPKPAFLFGNSSDLKKHGLLDAIGKWHVQYGDVFGLLFGTIPMTCVFDVDILKEILVKDFTNFSDRFVMDLNKDPVSLGLFFQGGSSWKRQRMILSPTFTAGKLRLMTGHIQKCAQTLTSIFEEHAQEGKSADVKSIFGDFTMDVIASTAFGIEIDSQRNPDNLFVYHGKKIFSSSFLNSPAIILATLFPSTIPILKKLGISVLPKDAVTFFTSTMKKMIEERKLEPQAAQKHTDFLQLMLNAEAEIFPGDNASEQQGKRLTHDEIIAQGFLFFIAGFQTTRTLLQFIAYCLATHPDTQDKLFNEIKQLDDQQELNYEDICKLQYLENVIKETLRLYPSVSAINRKVLNTTTINGYKFPARNIVFIPIFHIMRDPRNFPDPLSFKPDRWEDKSDMNPLTNLAFGYGPRLCIGMRLAMLEVKVALIEILRKVKFVREEDTPDTIVFSNKRGMGDLEPITPIKLKIEVRS